MLLACRRQVDSGFMEKARLQPGRDGRHRRMRYWIPACFPATVQSLTLASVAGSRGCALLWEA